MLKDSSSLFIVIIKISSDGERCGQTLFDLFANAKDPDKVVVGLVEQNYEEADDPYCLEVYCKLHGKVIYTRNEIRKDTTKVIAKYPDRETCPRVSQIRKLSVHNHAAKGPTWARSLGRKVLGNEEFCLQIDAHSKFVKDWDEKLKQEWVATQNEFAIISTQPSPTTEQDDASLSKIVPRNCAVEFLEVQIPVSLRGV
jgi:hypothetical protein